MRPRRGSTLIVSLMLCAFLLVVGLGFLSQRAGQYQAANTALWRVRAQALADAGLEDARIKLAKDGSFPPLEGDDQEEFSYTEELRDAGGESLGFYTVHIDMRYRRLPYKIYRVTSRGRVGTLEAPRAQATRMGEFDVSPVERGTTNLNPLFFRFRYVTSNAVR